MIKRTIILAAVVLATVTTGTSARAADNKSELKRKDTGYRGIWFTLGQYSQKPYAKRFWPYGDKYSGGLGTYTAKPVHIAVYAPQVKKTFFCYGGSKKDKRYLHNMISYYDHEKDRVPRPTIIHDKGGVNDPHDDSSLTIDDAGHIWVYVAGRGRIRPGFVYRSVKPYDIDRFEQVSSDEICYPQPYHVPGRGILELFTKYTGNRELYWNIRNLDGSRGKDQKLAGAWAGNTKPRSNAATASSPRSTVIQRACAIGEPISTTSKPATWARRGGRSTVQSSSRPWSKRRTRRG